MAFIAAAVEAAVASVVAVAIESTVEAAVAEAVAVAVTAAVESAITQAITIAIASAVGGMVAASVAGSVSSMVATNMFEAEVEKELSKSVKDATELIETNLEKELSQSMKDVIGPQGVKDLAKAMSTMSWDAAVNKLVKSAMNTLHPHLPSEITQPKKFAEWLHEEVVKIAGDFAIGPINTVAKEVSEIVMGELKKIIVLAGEEAKSWTKSEGRSIMWQSLIPIYGMIMATKRLYYLKSDALDKFHSGAQSALATYKDECLGEKEQARRKQRILEETDKVLLSKKWKDRIASFEETIASKMKTL